MFIDQKEIMTTPPTIGRYIIKEELGKGGMATVFLAQDPRFERDVALKVLPHAFLHDPAFRQRFEREAKTIASLEHQAIVPVYDFGEHEGQPYLVMRHMAGGSLLDRMRQGPMPLEEAARIIGRLASALDKAHEAGIIHRDLKPGNVLFDQYGDAYLSDFGIAKLLEQSAALTGTGSVIGTPAYMSPEQAKGVRDIDGRSDIYALGAILFEMLTGKLPYNSDTPMGLVVKHIMEPVPRIRDSNPDLPLGVEGVISRSMAKERDQRFQTTNQMALELNKIDLSAAKSGGASIAKTVVEPFAAPPPAADTAVPFAVEDPERTVIEQWQGQAAVDATVVEHYEEPAIKVEEAAAAARPVAESTATAGAPPSKQPRRRFWLWGIVGVVLLALLFFGGRLLLSGGGDTSSTIIPETASGMNMNSIEQCANILAPTQADVMVRFVNESSFEGVGLWQDNSQSPTQLREYFRVTDGEMYDQETFESDKWVIQEPSGATLLEYIASVEEKQCVLIKRPVGNLWLNFVNESGVPAIGYLVGANGAEETYFGVGAGAMTGLWSAEGNIWRVKDDSGNQLLEYSSTDENEQQVVIPPLSQ